MRQIEYRATVGYHDIGDGVKPLVLLNILFNGDYMFDISHIPNKKNEIQITGESQLRKDNLTKSSKGDVNKVLFLEDPNYNKLKLRKSFFITKDLPLEVGDEDVRLLHSLFLKNNNGNIDHPCGGKYPKFDSLIDLERVLKLITLSDELKAKLNKVKTLDEKLSILYSWRLAVSKLKNGDVHICAKLINNTLLRISTLPNAGFELESTEFTFPSGGGAGSGTSSTLITKTNDDGEYDFEFNQPASGVKQRFTLSARIKDAYGNTGNTGTVLLYDTTC